MDGWIAIGVLLTNGSCGGGRLGSRFNSCCVTVFHQFGRLHRSCFALFYFSTGCRLPNHTRCAVAASRTKREEMSDLESVKDQSKAGTGRIKFPCEMLRFRVNLFCLARQLITAIKWPLRFLISCNEHEHTKTK